jgi:sortase A
VVPAGIDIDMLRALERLLCLIGVVLLGIYGTHLLAEEFKRTEDLAAFRVVPEQALWSEGRIAAFEKSLTQPTSNVLGILEIPRLQLEVPVYDGASELHMDRGAARIEGTAMPGEPGNLGIAGHRDGYFRVLKDIQLGDEIMITTSRGPESFVVQDLSIVNPTAIEVLEPTEQQSVTLVTCYPFYFVGHAPERFIVRAVRKEQAQEQEY